MVQFGKRDEEYVGKGTGKVFIKYFGDGDTKVRPLQSTKDWQTYEAHFNRAHKVGFPCGYEAGFESCIGCASDSPEVKETSVKSCAPFIDEKGYLSVFEFGPAVKKLFKFNESRKGTILDRDYVVNRSGKGFDTEYALDFDERSEIDPPAGLDDLDIGALLLERYEYAASKMGGVEELEREAQDSADEGGVTDPDDMSVSQLREYLDNCNVEYKANSPRSALVKLVNDRIEKGDPPF